VDCCFAIGALAFGRGWPQLKVANHDGLEEEGQRSASHEGSAVLADLETMRWAVGKVVRAPYSLNHKFPSLLI